MSKSEALYAKLSPGPGRSASEVATHQRMRIHGAMIELAGSGGYGTVTVRGLTRAAGVSSSSFYAHFESKGECFLETFDLAMRRLARRVAASQRGAEGDWRQRFRAGVEALVWTLASEPKTARVCLIEVFDAGDPGLQRLRRADTRLDTVMHDVLARAPDGESVPGPLVKAIVAGIVRVIRAALLADRAEDLPGLADGLVEWALGYRGAASSGLWACDSPRCAGGPAGIDFELDSVVGDERLQILAATARLAARDGRDELTPARIGSAAGLSGTAFGRHFGDVEECFFAAAELLLARALGDSLRDAAPGRSWAGRVFRALSALCERVAREPELARVALLDPLWAGSEGVRRHDRLIGLGSEWLRRSAPAACRPRELDAKASLGAAWGLVNHRILTGRTAELPRQAGALAFLVLAPALGPVAATEAIRAESELAAAS